MHDKILILDFGSQLTQLIARRVRESGVYSEIKPYNTDITEIKKFDAKAIILSGGPASVNHEFSPKIPAEILQLNLPILGICYGQQLLCEMLGGMVEPASDREFGKASLQIKNSDHALFTDVLNDSQVWMSHGDKVTKLPENFVTIATTDNAPYAAIANDKDKIYGLQFHPEVTHSIMGKQIISNFIYKIAKCNNDWNMKEFMIHEIDIIKAKIGDKKVIAAVSGGVDSSVAATIIHRAIGEQLHCIFVDTGLLRKNEAEAVCNMFEQQLKIPLDYVNAKDRYFDALKGITEPEAKRKIIGKLFIDIFEEKAKKVGDADFLMQGTLYPDVIESISVHGDASVTIKSHHNVGGLPDVMQLKLIEPLKELFKDEVRILGNELGLHDDVVNRHPFPGPGLGIRVLGEVTKERVAILQEADVIFIDEIKKAGLYAEIWQAFAALLPVNSVGVMGDSRTYEAVCTLRAVTSVDGMTADYYQFPTDFLGMVANKIINNVRGINRVVYDYTSKPPGTIEWE